MRATWLTDLHLDFLNAGALSRFLGRVREQAPDVLLVTGDTGEGRTFPRFVELLQRIAPTYFVLGNHDFYRSSIEEARRRAASLGGYLPASGVVRLTPRTCLVGVDGWGDARAGNAGSPVRLNDWRLIGDLRGLEHGGPERRARVLGELGRRDAGQLRALLAGGGAGDDLDDLLVLTHVPPFVGACWHDGAISDPDWLPWFTCVSTGEVLEAFARERPEIRVTTLCGHTHGRGEFVPRSNLRVRTGGWGPGEQDYGNPVVQDTWELA
jgi:3',5'-cyclic AMP phosphodiesterase CpdA